MPIDAPPFKIASTDSARRTNRQSGEVPLGPRPDPQRHGARAVAVFEIVHDQRGLLGAMDEEARLGAVDDDAHARPRARLEIDVALVFLRRLLARLGEVEVGKRAVLRGVVAAHLIVGAPVGRPKIDVLEAIVLQAEGDADESSRRRTGAGSRKSGNLGLDRAVLKLGALEHRVRFSVANLAVL